MTSDTARRWEFNDYNPSAMSGTSSLCSTTPSQSQDWQENPREKAQRLWTVLRKAISSTVIKVRKSDLKSIHLTHGIAHLRHISFQDPVRHVTYSHQRKGFISLDAAGRIHLHQPDGLVGDSLQPAGALVGLLHASKVSQYVAWDADSLKVLSADFAVISTTQPPQEVRCAVYNPELNEVLTGGPGCVIIWHFRVGFRHLACQKVMSEGFSECDVVSLLALERASLQSQRCFAVCDTGVAVLNLSDGALIAFRRDLHLRPITAIVYSEATKLLVTASWGTSIKVWDENWHIRTVFVGHTGPITAVALHHTGTLFFSASLDCTIRTWDLETADQVDEVQVKEGVLGLGTHGEGQFLVSYSNHGQDQWQVRHLYDLYAMVGSPVTDITTVDLSQIGSFPPRALCVCKDSTVRLVALHTGHVLSTLLLDRPKQVAAVEYCLPRETIFVLTEQGDLLKVNTLTNPMSVVRQVSAGSIPARYSCLTLYSFIKDEKKAFSQWKNVVEQKGERWPRRRVPLSIMQEEKNRYLLIAGRDDGVLSVLDWYTGREQCQVKAHNSGKVIKVISSPQNNCVISAGSDLTIKVWRVFPYADESLSLEMTFYCSHSVVRMCTMKSLLTVAFQDPASATYSIVQYNLLNKDRADHRPGEDPHDDITGLCCCPRFKLFASASRDGSVKIWNQENQLVRHMNLSAIPESLAFGSNQGDLLVGIQRNIYRIDLVKYLPNQYQVKCACMEVLKPVPDPPVPILETSLSKDSQKRLMDPRSSINRSQVSLVESTREDQICMKECTENKKEFAVLADRDQELLLIQQGKLHSSKKPKRTKATEKEAFERYLSLFYSDRPRVKIPKVDPFDVDVLLMPPTPPAKENPYNPKGVKGFFPDPLEANYQCVISDMYQKGEKIPILPFSFVPNSVLVRLLWPLQVLQRQFDKDGKLCEKPPCLAELQAELGEELDLSKYLELVEDEEGYRGLVEEQEEDEEDKKQAILKKLASVPVKKRPSSIPVPVPTPAPDEVPVPASPVSKKREDFASTKRKDFKVSLPPLPEKPPSTSIAVKSTTPPPPSPTPSPTPSPSPSPLPTLPAPSPLPHFVLQFQLTDWFHVLFPDAGPQAFPTTITVSEFVSQLLEGFKVVNFQMKVEIIDAILLLYEQEGFQNVKEVHDALITGLNPKKPLNLQVQEQKDFILASLRALKILFCDSKELTLELMTYFQQATLGLRKTLMALFEDLGLQDPHGYFYKEMDSWEIWKETDSSKAPVKGTCCRWLDDWIAKLQDHVVKVLQILPKGTSLTRASSRSLQSKKGHASKVLLGASTTRTSSHSLQSKKGHSTGVLKAVSQEASLTDTSSRAVSSKKDHETRLGHGVSQGASETGISSQSLQSKKDHETRLGHGVPQGASATGISSQSLQSKTDHESGLEHGVPQGTSSTGTSSQSLQSKKDHETRLEQGVPQGTSATGASSHSLQSKKVKRSKVRIASQADICLELSPIEAINYFCEVQHDKAMQALKQQQVPKKADEKNTVVSLPAKDRCEAIMRLGETHSMSRTRQTENFYLPPISQHNFLSGFGPFINFPVKKINLNPFPSLLDLEITPSLIASLNQMAHRYFILDHSFPESYSRRGASGLADAERPERYRGLKAPVPPHS